MVLVILRYSFAPLAVCHLHSCFYLCRGNTTNRQHRDNSRAPLREQRNWVNSLTKAHGNLLIVDVGGFRKTSIGQWMAAFIDLQSPSWCRLLLIFAECVLLLKPQAIRLNC